MPATRLDRANWHYSSPRWKHGIGRSALAAVWAQDRRGRNCRRFFLVYELLFTLRRTQGEPSGAMRGPRERPWRPPDGSDGSDGADGESREGGRKG